MMNRSAGNSAQPVVVSVTGLSKSFPGQRAVTDVTLALTGGEIHVLCGQNGSGKSTLIKMLSGFHEPDPGGRIELLGEEIRPWRGEGIRRMHFIHQELGLIESLNAMENLALGHGYGARGLRPIRWREQRQVARGMLRSLGIHVDVDIPVAELTALERTMIAVARALRGWDGATGLLVLDEPTVAMSKPEVDGLFGAMKEIAARGAAVLYVSHRLEEVFNVGDRVSVLREGRLVLSSPVAETDHDALVDAIAGRAVESITMSPHGQAAPVALAVRDLVAHNLRGVSLELRKGEILGVTGLAGSGVDELPEVLFGAMPIASGAITREGEPVGPLTPPRAKRLGIALLPSNRAVKGSIPAFTVRENITLPYLRPLITYLGVNARRERREVLEWMKRVELRPADPELRFGALSGGNQQKALIARWLRTRPAVLLLHEPTQGVDVGARAAIHQLLIEAARNGTGVLACSCDVVDLIRFCHRVLILAHGKLVNELTGDRLTEENVWNSLLRQKPVAAPLAVDTILT